MGNTVFIRNKRVCVKPLRSRIEAIQRLKPPMTIKECRSFMEMVNFVSIFCPELQKHLKPIYDLTRKGRHFVWGEEEQNAFEEIKGRLQRPPVLHLPDRQGQFQLYSDMSKLPLVVHCIKFKMGSLNVLPTQVKECQKQLIIIQL